MGRTSKKKQTVICDAGCLAVNDPAIQAMFAPHQCLAREMFGNGVIVEKVGDDVRIYHYSRPTPEA